MNLEISVPEVLSLIKEIQGQPERLFKMIRVDMRQSVGKYLSEMMKAELTEFLGRERYERVAGNENHRNGSYDRGFTLKGIGKVAVKVPRDREGAFKTEIIPRSKQYEDEIREDLSFMFLTGISTRTLSMMSERLIGRAISPTEVSNANKALRNGGSGTYQRPRSNICSSMASVLICALTGVLRRFPCLWPSVLRRAGTSWC